MPDTREQILRAIACIRLDAEDGRVTPEHASQVEADLKKALSKLGD